MRHKKNVNHLGRKSEHRKAMLSNMANSLILHKRITTTLAKAKALRTYIEPLITKAKNDSTHSRRMVFSLLQNKDAVSELFREISQKIADRPGGYTRILKTGTRLGDNAEMCVIELVDYNELLLGQKDEKARPTRRRRIPRKKEASGTKTKIKEQAAVAEPVENTDQEIITGLTDQPVEEIKEEPAAEIRDETSGEDQKKEV